MNGRIKSMLEWLLKRKVIVVFFVLYILSCFAFQEKNFFSLRMINNLLRKAGTEGGIITLGMTFVFLTGYIDLTASAVVALSATVCALTVYMGPIMAVVCGILTGSICGFLTGWVIAKLRVQAYVTTLSLMLGFRGIVYILTNLDSLPVRDRAFNAIANTSIGPFSILGILLIVLTMLCAFISTNTRFGVALYAVGGNEEAAKMMGLNVDFVKIMAYTISGTLAGLNGMLLCSRLNVAQAVAAEGWESTAIACCALSGIKLSGGKGTFGAAFFGVMVIQIVKTIFNYAGNINSWWQNTFMGLILLLAVILQSTGMENFFDRIRKRRV